MTIRATARAMTATEVLLIIMTMPTLACPTLVQCCRNQNTGMRKRKTREKFRSRVSRVLPSP